MSYMVRFIFTLLTLLTMAMIVAAQDSREPPKKYDVKRCTPTVVKHARRPKHLGGFAQKGEKSTGYAPLISFQVLESGEVADARVKRSSGFAHFDRYALEWIQARSTTPVQAAGSLRSNRVFPSNGLPANNRCNQALSQACAFH